MTQAIGEPMIRMQGVNKHFGDFHALKDINLEVPRGQVVVVLGPSGSGKSTLCRTINRLETIDSGTIEIDGKVLPAEGKELAKLRADVGMVFQQFNLFPHLTIRTTSPSDRPRYAKLQKRRPTPAPMSSSTALGLATKLTNTPPNCLAGNNNE